MDACYRLTYTLLMIALTTYAHYTHPGASASHAHACAPLLAASCTTVARGASRPRIPGRSAAVTEEGWCFFRQFSIPAESTSKPRAAQIFHQDHRGPVARPRRARAPHCGIESQPRQMACFLAICSLKAGPACHLPWCPRQHPPALR